MTLMLDSEIFYINSHNRLNEDDKHCDFSVKVDLRSDHYTHACVLQCEVPKCYYAIQSGYNTCTIVEYHKDDPVASSSFIVTIPPGNYEYDTFINILQTALNNGSVLGLTYVLTFDEVSAKISYLMNSDNLHNEIKGVDIVTTTNLYECMGLKRRSTFNLQPGVPAISPNVMDVSSENTLYLRSNLTHAGQTNILCTLNGSGVPMFGAIGYTCPDIEGYSVKLSNTKANTFRFQLTNEDGDGNGMQLLDTNGKNIVFSLLVYRKSDLYSMIKNVIRLSLLQDTQEQLPEP